MRAIAHASTERGAYDSTAIAGRESPAPAPTARARGPRPACANGRAAAFDTADAP
ncbi:hypothetical protein BDSB_09200 [Burkholderia dolosa PC543]|nr:hypothetical protein BDSB_09200 [Burkholderia dolosa PC543]